MILFQIYLTQSKPLNPRGPKTPPGRYRSDRTTVRCPAAPHHARIIRLMYLQSTNTRVEGVAHVSNPVLHSVSAGRYHANSTSVESQMTLKPSPAPSRNTPPGVAESATLMTTRALPVLPPAPLEAPCRHSESYDTAFAAHHRYLLLALR